MDLLIYVHLYSANSISQCIKVFEVNQSIKPYDFFWTKK